MDRHTDAFRLAIGDASCSCARRTTDARRRDHRLHLRRGTGAAAALPEHYDRRGGPGRLDAARLDCAARTTSPACFPASHPGDWQAAGSVVAGGPARPPGTARSVAGRAFRRRRNSSAAAQRPGDLAGGTRFWYPAHVPTACCGAARAAVAAPGSDVARGTGRGRRIGGDVPGGACGGAGYHRRRTGRSGAFGRWLLADGAVVGAAARTRLFRASAAADRSLARLDRLPDLAVVAGRPWRSACPVRLGSCGGRRNGDGAKAPPDRRSLDDAADAALPCRTGRTD